MEHWFDRATKLFAGGAISRRGMIEGGAVAGAAALVARTPAGADPWAAIPVELAQALPTSLSPCARSSGNGASTLTFAARSSYKGQTLTLRGAHLGRGTKHKSGRLHILVDLAGKTVLELVHSSTQTGTSKGRANPALQQTITYGTGYSGLHRVVSATQAGGTSGFADGRAFTAAGSSARMHDGKPAPVPHLDPALAQAVRALAQTASRNVGQCRSGSGHASTAGGSLAMTRQALLSPLRELARRTVADEPRPRQIAQTFPSGPCADCGNACDDKAVACEIAAGVGCALTGFLCGALGGCIADWNNCYKNCFTTGGPCCSVKCHPVNSTEASCCASGETCCGDTCCGNGFPVCSSPTSASANYGFCCPSGSHGCNSIAGGLSYDTCCTAGSTCCGTVCCSGNQFCASSALGACCAKGQSLCGGQCCSGKCTKDGVGNEVCCNSKSLCGGQCCGPNDKCLTTSSGSKICCNGSLCGSKCCGPGAICHNGQCAYGKPCGKGFCGLTNPVCCNGVCCASNQTCKNGKCTTAACKRKGTVPCQDTPGLCCKPGATCCGKTCCKPGMPCCGGICTTNQCIQ